MLATTPERMQKLFTTFKTAIEAEKDAQDTYLRLKDLCDDPALREVLDGFYQDEKRHELELIKRYKMLRLELGIDD